MERIQLNKDVYPISEVRNNFSELIKKAKNTKRPMLVTQNGKGKAIILDVDQYEELLDIAELSKKETLRSSKLRKAKP